VRLNRGVCGSKEFDFARLRAQPARRMRCSTIGYWMPGHARDAEVDVLQRCARWQTRRRFAVCAFISECGR
jgi:hypothetical protein